MAFASRLGVICFVVAGQASAASALPDCVDKAQLQSAVITSVTASHLQLADGSVLTPAGIHVPDDMMPRALARMTDVMRQQPVRYAPLQKKRDRYGRIPSAILIGSDAEALLQNMLVGEGLALAFPFGASFACGKDLLAAEAGARRAKRGLWQHSPLIDAGNTKALLQSSGRFVLVEGTLKNVVIRDYAAFLNFNVKWRRGFSVMLLKKDEAVFALAASLQPLAGRRLRVRGVVDNGTSPRMALEAPEALEILP